MNDAKQTLKAVDVHLAPNRPGVVNWQQAWLAGVQGPQYRRTYLQGCVCKTGIAAGACCPAHAMGAAAPTVHAVHQGAVHGVWAGVTGVLGVVGMINGARVLSLSYDALTHLRRMDTALQYLERDWALAASGYAQAPGLPHAEALSRARYDAIAGLRYQVQRSRHEQIFNLVVPGALQLSASAATTWVVAHALGVGLLGAAGVTIAAMLAGGLFALYGVAQAGKVVLEAVRERRVVPMDDAAMPHADYRAAFEAHRTARRQHQMRTGFAWGAVAAAGLMGIWLTTRALPIAPGAWLAVAALGFGAAAWAMWQSSRTRYAPHVPLSAHVDPNWLVDTCSSDHSWQSAQRLQGDSARRANLWEHLAKQQAAILKAVDTLNAQQPAHRQALYQVEKLFQPQCGPRSFRVLAHAVAHPRDVKQQALYDHILLDAAQTFVTHERNIWYGRCNNQRASLERRYLELKAQIAPCPSELDRVAAAQAALAPDAPSEVIYQQASESLREDALQLERAARTLAVLDYLDATLTRLHAHVGDLRAVGSVGQGLATPEHIVDWAYARVLLMQLQGTLGDAIDDAMIEADRRGPNPIFSELGTGAYPVGNVHVLPHQLDRFVQTLAPRLDAAFVHAFCNPRRLEGEMDFILERELAERQPEAVALRDVAQQAAPACEGAACCH